MTGKHPQLFHARKYLFISIYTDSKKRMSSNKRAKTTNMPAPIAMRSSMDAPPSKTPRNCIEFEFVTPNMVDYPFMDEVRAMMYAQVCARARN
jgi:hypothetical protein